MWVVGQATPLNNANPEQVYYFDMKNWFGMEVLESFILVVPKTVTVQMKSENYLRCEQIGDVDLYVWQKHVPGSEDHPVKVGLNVENRVR